MTNKTTYVTPRSSGKSVTKTIPEIPAVIHEGLMKSNPKYRERFLKRAEAARQGNTLSPKQLPS